ncbi:MAG: nuclear transport factor 2 family protein [Gammaproteobacteria bacterium]|nr:nuclear transport factor 2 family protein [Gammaproteobacteria bacterium]
MSEEYVAIRELCERYVDAVNRRDAADWSATWAPDAVWDLGRGPVSGRENIVAMWEAAMAGLSHVIMWVHSGVIESVEGDQASARWYHQETLDIADGSRMVGMGVYRDKLVRIDAKWHFSERRYHLLYLGPPDLSGNFNAYPSK